MYDTENLTLSGNIFLANNSTAINVDSNSCLISNNDFFTSNRDSIRSYDSENFSIIRNNFHLINSEAAELYNVQNCIFSCNTLNGDQKQDGIQVVGGLNIIITNNTMNNVRFGIVLSLTQPNIVSNNSFFNTWYAILIQQSINNTIESNTIDNTIGQMASFPTRGITLSDIMDSVISKNQIRHCYFGIYIDSSSFMMISKNNFEKNIIHARFLNAKCEWDQNYWGRPRIFPKPIFGIKDSNSLYPGFVEFDWHPARIPYDFA